MSFFRPIAPLLRGWLIAGLLFGLVALVLGFDQVREGFGTWEDAGRAAMRNWLPWALITPLLFRLVERFPLDRQTWRKSSLVHLACAAVLFTAGYLWKDVWFKHERFLPPGASGFPRGGPPPGTPPIPGDWHGSQPGPGGERPLSPPPREFGGAGRPPLPPDFANDPLRPPPPAPPPPPRGFLNPLHLVSHELPIYLMILAGAHAALFFRREQERAAHLAEARLQALQVQLQPHFLFNTLNTIAGLVHEEPNRADALLTTLGELLRLALHSSATDARRPLRRELEYVHLYLELMHARFEDRLRVELQFSPDTLEACVPSFIVAPLIESAVEQVLEHGPHGAGVVVVRSKREGDTLLLTVTKEGCDESDPPISIPLEETSTLANVRTRLKELYNGRATLRLPSIDQSELILALPFQRCAEPLPLTS